MPLLEDLLLRFRRVWSPPGAVVGQAGVPEEAGTRFDDEIRELSSELGGIDAEAEALVKAAELEAAAIADAGAAEATRVVEAARGRLPAVRAERAAARVRERQADIDGMLAGAEAEAAAIRERARDRIPALAANAVEEIFESAVTSEERHAGVVGRR